MASQGAAPSVAAAAPKPKNKASVKQVLSGDTIVLRGKPTNGPPPERTLSFAHISAPRLARRPNDGETATGESAKDEPFAWECREYLRKRLVGKDVKFTVEYAVPSGREFGTVWIDSAANGTSENIVASLVKEGLAKVRPVSGNHQRTEEYEELVAVEAEAQAAGKGVWAKDAPASAVRSVVWNVDNSRTILDQFQGKPTDAIIEQVRDGTTVRAFLLPSFQYITVSMSGVKSPSVRREDGKEVAEPFALEARYFTEVRLLQREVKILLEGVSSQSQNTFLGSILHPAGSISEALVREGLAKCVDWSMAVVSQGREKLRAAEKEAKQKKLRIWKNFVAAEAGSEIKEKEFVAKVVEIVNAETLMVRVAPGDVRRISLSSIRQPKALSAKDEEGAAGKRPAGNRQQQLFDVPYLFEAREFLRKKLIGKKVKVEVDYVKPASDGFPERIAATVTMDGVNISEALVSKGYATVLRHRADDEQRSKKYDELLVAENRAQKGQKGVHSPKEPPKYKVPDASEDLKKARERLPFLQRAGRTPAVVEYVASGSRLRLFLPKETCYLTFLLSGIKCPRASIRTGADAGQKGEPYGDEALEFTRDRAFQRDVDVEVETIDNRGGFVGTVYIDGESLAVGLVEQGFAFVFGSLEKTPNARELKASEERARAKLLGVWKDYKEEPVEDTKAEAADESDRKVDLVEVGVTDVIDGVTFWAQPAASSAKLNELMGALAEHFEAHPPLPGSYSPKTGDLVAALFSADETWYRARVQKVVSAGDVHVHYVDFGNSEAVPSTSLAILPSQYHSLPAQAVEYKLAFVSPPMDEEWAFEAANLLRDLILNKTLKINVEYKKDNKTHVTALEDGAGDITRVVLAEGLGLLERRRERRFASLIQDYAAAQDSAKAARLSMWQYGDLTADDAKEFGFKPREKATDPKPTAAPAAAKAGKK
eukprot:Opistho-2@21860